MKGKIMKYRKFGKLDWQASALGFGAMRLPVIDRNPNNIDEPLAISMLRYAFDHGVNYVDSAYGYHGGNSERIVGKALKDGYREKVKIATKCPTWMLQSADDYDKFLDEQLKKLQTDKIDLYLFHGLAKNRWEKIRELKVLKRAEKAVADGRIGHIGFSFHDSYDAFKEILDGYDNWTMCQVQYNYMDIDIQAGTKGVQYAANKGLAVVVMEPVRGGRLANPPEAVTKVWQDFKPKRNAVERALQWVWNQPEISLALSGMSTMEQVVENVEIAGRSGVGILKKNELALYDRIRDAFKGLCPIPCTACRYCMPCPNGVDIPQNFQIYNEAIMYNNPQMGRAQYRGGRGLTPEQQADKCIDCDTCVELCPQKIDVPEWMKKVHAFLGPPPSKPEAPKPVA
jgi:predicted aldo/keto reductase-like oxidoreductase